MVTGKTTGMITGKITGITTNLSIDSPTRILTVSDVTTSRTLNVETSSEETNWKGFGEISM